MVFVCMSDSLDGVTLSFMTRMAFEICPIYISFNVLNLLYCLFFSCHSFLLRFWFLTDFC